MKMAKHRIDDHNPDNAKFRRANRKNEIAITIEDIVLIMGNDYGEIDSFLSSTFCRRCEDQTTITDFAIYLDDTNDIIFDGKCIHCHEPVARYIETGESEKSADMARHIRNVNTISYHGSH
jgi:hypothetical protein